MLEVILKQEVRNLGDKGDIVRVANGYARNFLFPKEMAMPATTANKKQIDEMKASADREAARLQGDAKKLADLLKALTVEITARAGESDQLFGSVTTRDIVAHIAEQGYTIDRHKVIIKNPIRTVGDHEVTIHLHRDVEVLLPVKVRAEGREDEPVAEEAVKESQPAAEESSDEAKEEA